MDAHFEVILERIKQLTSKSKETVWYEFHTTTDGRPVLVLANKSNNIGLIGVSYNSDNKPDLVGFKMTRQAYDKITHAGLETTSKPQVGLQKSTPAKVVRWISRVT